MKEILIIVLICLALSGQLQSVLAVLYVLGAWAAIFWVLKKIGIFSAPRRASDAAGRAAYNGMMNMFRGPSKEEIARERERQQAKKDYAFHSYQAERYKGSRDGAWHEDTA